MRPMPARERVELTLNFEKTDRIPVFDSVRNPGFIAHYANLPVRNSYSLEEVGKAIGNALDLVRALAPYSEKKQVIKENGFVFESRGWSLWQSQRPFSTEKQLAQFIESEIEMIHRLPAEVKVTALGKREVPPEFSSYRDWFKYMQKMIGDTVLFHIESPVGLDVAYPRADLELFSYLYQDNPELISRWLKALLNHEIKRVHTVADRKLSPIAFVYADIAYKHSTLFSPIFLRREFFPCLKKLVNAWHQHDIKVIYHSDGNLMSVMDELVATGIDGINPLEPVAGMDLKTVRRKYPQLVLIGNIDCTELLSHGTKNEVAKAVKQAIDDVAEQGGYILSSSSELHPGCRTENCITMIEVAKEYGRSKEYGRYS